MRLENTSRIPFERTFLAALFTHAIEFTWCGLYDVRRESHVSIRDRRIICRFLSFCNRCVLHDVTSFSRNHRRDRTLMETFEWNRTSFFTPEVERSATTSLYAMAPVVHSISIKFCMRAFVAQLEALLLSCYVKPAARRHSYGFSDAVMFRTNFRFVPTKVGRTLDNIFFNEIKQYLFFLFSWYWNCVMKLSHGNLSGFRVFNARILLIIMTCDNNLWVTYKLWRCIYFSSVY